MAESKHSCSGFDADLRIASSSSMISSNGLANTELEHEVLARARVLGVVHRAHVQRRHLRAAGAQVGDPLLDRHADRAGRVVDDHRVADLGADRVGDRAEVLDLIARRAVRAAGVDVDVTPPSSDDPPRLGGVLLGRVRDRRALVAVGDRAGDRAGDDDGVLDGSCRCLQSLEKRRTEREARVNALIHLSDDRVDRCSRRSSLPSVPVVDGPHAHTGIDPGTLRRTLHPLAASIAAR